MILITGATGFVGRHLAARLQTRDEPLRLLVRSSTSASDMASGSTSLIEGSVTDPSSLSRAMDGVTTVIHLVAIIVERGTSTFASINAQGTRNVVAAASGAGVKRFLHMSANAAADLPQYPYLQTKWQGQHAVEQSGLAYGILRPSLIFGSGDQFFTTLAKLVRMNPVVPIVGDGKSMFQPIWVEDVVTCFERMLDDDALLGRTYDVGGPEQVTYEEMVDIIMRVLGTRKPKIHVPVALMKPAAAVLATLLAHPPVTPGQLDLLAIPNTTRHNPLPVDFGIERPGILQEKLDYL